MEAKKNKKKTWDVYGSPFLPLNKKYKFLAILTFLLIYWYKLTIASYKVRIERYKLTIASYKVRIERYKLTIASYKVRIERYKLTIGVIKSDWDINSQLRVIKSELRDINSQLRVLKSNFEGGGGGGADMFSRLRDYISQFWLYNSQLWVYISISVKKSELREIFIFYSVAETGFHTHPMFLQGELLNMCDQLHNYLTMLLKKVPYYNKSKSAWSFITFSLINDEE